jgi:hypothetical protein
MDALALRDQVFSALHIAALKPSGYKKKGHWITRDLGALVHAFYLRASRFGDRAEAIFWIDVQIFSAEWHSLVFPERPYKGPSEGPSLDSRELGAWCFPPLTTLRLSAESDPEALLASLSKAVIQEALPFLEQRKTPETLLANLLKGSEPDRHLTIASLSRLLGQESQAREYMTLAKQNAVHDNELRFLELRERNIWRNAVQPFAAADGSAAR